MRSVEAEGLLDNGLVKRQLGEVLVGEWGQVGTENVDLLLVQFLHDVGARREAEHDPGARGGGRVLPGHARRAIIICAISWSGTSTPFL